MLSVARLVSFWRCIPVQYNCQKPSNFQGLSHFSRIFGKNDKIPEFFQAGKTVTIFPGFPGAVGTLPLYDVLGKEMKMGPVDLPLEAWKAVDILKRKIQSMPVLVFPDFNKPFMLETDASKEGLGAVLSQKQSDGCYHPVAFGSHSLTPLEKNYHSSKLEFIALKWSVTEHFKEYLAYSPFMV